MLKDMNILCMYKDVVIRKIKKIILFLFMTMIHEHLVFQSICPPVHPFFVPLIDFVVLVSEMIFGYM